MLHIAGGIVLGMVFLAFLPVIGALIGLAVVGIVRLALYVGVPMLLLLLVVYSLGWGKDNLANMTGVWLGVGIVAVAVAWWLLRLKWNFGSLKTGLGYTRVRLRSERSLDAIQNKEAELAHYIDIRDKRRARRKADADQRRASNALARFRGGYGEMQDRLKKFVGTNPDFRTEVDEDKFRIDVYFRGERLCGVVPDSPPYFKMKNDNKGPYVAETPKTPYAIAGKSRRWLRSA